MYLYIFLLDIDNKSRWKKIKGLLIPFGIFFVTECFAKIVRIYKYFSKSRVLDSGFWRHPSLNKYSLTCRVPQRYVLCAGYSEPCLLL